MLQRASGASSRASAQVVITSMRSAQIRCPAATRRNVGVSGSNIGTGLSRSIQTLGLRRLGRRERCHTNVASGALLTKNLLPSEAATDILDLKNSCCRGILFDGSKPTAVGY